MNIPRSGYGLAKTSDGKILILGGKDENQKIQKTAEIYDPKTNSFKLVKFDMDFWTYFDIKSLELQDNNVFLIMRDKACIFYNKDNSFMPIGNKKEYSWQGPNYKSSVNDFHNTQYIYMSSLPILLNKNEILIIGLSGFLFDYGNYRIKPPTNELGSAEIYNIKNNASKKIANRSNPRYGESTVRLKDGKVLITGGILVSLIRKMLHFSIQAQMNSLT